MRTCLLSLFIGIGSVSFANEKDCRGGLGRFRTQDNVNYAATFKPGLTTPEIAACLERIKTLALGRGNGFFDHLELVEVVLVNLTTAAARDVGALDCVHAIEVDRVNTI